MPNRVCSSCKKNLTSYDYYFCSNCGSVLEFSLTSEPVLKDQTFVLYSQYNKHSFKNKLPDLLTHKIFLFIIFVFSIFLFFFSLNYRSVKNLQIQNKKISSVNNFCGDLFICGNFLDHNASKYVPLDVELYAESFDFDKLSELLIEYDQEYTELISALKYMQPKHIAMYVKNSSKSLEWAFLLKSDHMPSDRLISYFTNRNNLFFGKIGEYYYISNYSQVYNDLSLVKEQKKESIFKDVTFSYLINKFKQGQILIISKSNNVNPWLSSFLTKKELPFIINQIITNLTLQKQGYLML